VRAYIEAGDVGSAEAQLAQLEDNEDADWRITWYHGLAALAVGDVPRARGHFDTAYDLLPGEAAPKLALAACEEGVGNVGAAGRLYELVWRTDHAYTSAAFGLARTRLQQGDIPGAVAAAESVPQTSSQYLAARLVAIRARIGWASEGRVVRVEDQSDAERFLLEAGTALATLELDAARVARTSIGILDAAHALVSTRTVSTRTNGTAGGQTVLGCTLDDRSLRRGLEKQYRTLARLAHDKPTRAALVIRANAVRPVTWI